MTVRWLRWLGGDERSLEAHRDVLDRLHHLATPDRESPAATDGGPIPHVRVLQRGSEGVARGPWPQLGVDRRAVLDAAVGADRPATSGPRRRPGFPVVAAAGAAVVAAVVAVVLRAAPSPPLPSPLRPISSTAHPPARVAAPPSAPATTVPAVLVPLGSNPSQVNYTVGARVVSLSVSTTGSCWAELRSSSASGPLLYQGVLTQGTVKTFQAADLWIRLGFPPGVRMEANGSSVELPSTAAPLNILVTGSGA